MSSELKCVCTNLHRCYVCAVAGAENLLHQDWPTFCLEAMNGGISDVHAVVLYCSLSITFCHSVCLRSDQAVRATAATLLAHTIN
jgi:hypothetical protein